MAAASMKGEKNNLPTEGTMAKQSTHLFPDKVGDSWGFELDTHPVLPANFVVCSHNASTVQDNLRGISSSRLRCVVSPVTG